GHKTSWRSGVLCRTAGLAYVPRTCTGAGYRKTENTPKHAELLSVFSLLNPREKHCSNLPTYSFIKGKVLLNPKRCAMTFFLISFETANSIRIFQKFGLNLKSSSRQGGSIMALLDEILEYNEEFVKEKRYEEYMTTKFPDKKVVILT